MLGVANAVNRGAVEIVLVVQERAVLHADQNELVSIAEWRREE